MKNLIKNKTCREMVKFGLVGFSGAVVDLGVYNILWIFLGWNIYLSRSISFILAATDTYIFNRVWTFRNFNKNIVKQYSRFFFISSVGLLLNLLIMRILAGPASGLESDFLRKNVPVLAAIVIVFFWNYTANKLWTFKNE